MRGILSRRRSNFWRNVHSGAATICNSGWVGRRVRRGWPKCSRHNHHDTGGDRPQSRTGQQHRHDLAVHCAGGSGRRRPRGIRFAGSRRSLIRRHHMASRSSAPSRERLYRALCGRSDEPHTFSKAVVRGRGGKWLGRVEGRSLPTSPNAVIESDDLFRKPMYPTRRCFPLHRWWGDG
jgi:hypothetical protein